jgi:hypothetical protein
MGDRQANLLMWSCMGDRQANLLMWSCMGDRQANLMMWSCMGDRQANLMMWSCMGDGQANLLMWSRRFECGCLNYLLLATDFLKEGPSRGSSLFYIMLQLSNI